LIADCVLDAQSGVLGVRDARVADVAIDGQRVFWRQPARPIEAAHGVVQFIGRLDMDFEDRPQYSNRRAQPQIRLVEQGEIARELDAATTRLYVTGAKST